MDGPSERGVQESDVDTEAITGETERWFIRQGLPHFIAEYTAREKVLPRAVPALMFSFLLSVLTTINPSWSLWRKGRFLVVSFLVLIVIWAAVNRVRGLPALRLPNTVGPVEIGVFVFAPTTLDLLVRTPRIAGTTFLVKIVHLVLIYYATSYGLLPMTYWNFRRVAEHIDVAFRLISRTFPLLLLAVTFLLFNGPTWKTMTRTVLPRYLAILLLFLWMTLVFMSQIVESKFDVISTFDSSDEIREYCAGSPVEQVAASMSEIHTTPELTRRERMNVVLMAIFSLWAYVMVGVLAVMLFFVLFGLLAIPNELVTVLVGRPIRPLFTITVFRTPISLTRELIRISGFVAVFAGLYLTVHGATDRTFHIGLDGSVAADVRRVLAVRAVYLTVLVTEQESESS